MKKIRSELPQSINSTFVKLEKVVAKDKRLRDSPVSRFWFRARDSEEEDLTRGFRTSYAFLTEKAIVPSWARDAVWRVERVHIVSESALSYTLSISNRMGEELVMHFPDSLVIAINSSSLEVGKSVKTQLNSGLVDELRHEREILLEILESESWREEGEGEGEGASGEEEAIRAQKAASFRKQAQSGKIIFL